MQDETQHVTRQTDVLDPARAQALHATLGLAGSFQSGDLLPTFYHHIFFWNALPAPQLGPDGHPATGEALIPDSGLPQRMWAGGAVTFHRPLILGQMALKTSRCDSVVEKKGASGRLAFVTLRHDYEQDGELCLTERQTLVYREETPMTARAAPLSNRTARLSETHTPDATLLFRYSALTFNGHRIHYDLDFAKGPGGYDGLVVHGPLLAQWLIRFAERDLGPLSEFSFRAVSPLINPKSARICADALGYWVETSEGQLCMTATAKGQ